MQPEDIEMMNLAIQEMLQASGRGPKVGAVLAQGTRVIGSGHKEPGVHAERAAIQRALDARETLKGSTLFTTLEPCVSVESRSTPCSQLIVEQQIQTVYIGKFDPNPAIYRAGWKYLRDAGVSLHDFPAPLRASIDEINQLFVEHFVSGTGPTGGAKFDYQIKRGRFEIQFSETDERSIVTEWTHRGPNSIYAYASSPAGVALARYAREFSEIDDPKAFEFSHTAPVDVGEIAVFATPQGAVLVKVVAVEAAHGEAAAQRSVQIQFQVRPE